MIGNCAFPHASVAPLEAQSLLDKSEKIFDRRKPKRDLSEMEASIERSRFIRYGQERWNEMRRRLEAGEPLYEVEAPVPAAERRALPAAPPAGPGLNVVLPYESGLSISGRKVVDFKMSSTIYAQPDSGKGRINKTDFQLDQQLQVRVKGTVGRKVEVNVDFDDTREDKRDIGVTYKGDPDEILQEASFGDITISLPGTDFVQYSKSVFGVRAELLFRPRTGFARMFPSALWHRYTPKKVRMFLIGSRTKGITQTKRFSGNSVLKRAGADQRGLNDIAYPRRQFFLLAFATGPALANDHRPIQTGSEKIFIDDQNPNNNNIDESTRTFVVVESTLTALGGVNPSSQTFQGVSGVGQNTGVFKQLVPGVDYTVDYLKGVIRFRRAIATTDILVADYTPTGAAQPLSQTHPKGGKDDAVPDDKDSTDALKGFKPFLLKPDERQFFATRELKNYYVLGDIKIQRDNGRGNFIFKIVDTNQNEPSVLTGTDVSSGTQTKPVPRYPNDVDVDFETGVFSFVSSDTFRSPSPQPFPDDIYFFRDAVPSEKHRYKIFVEYSTRKGNFNLEQTNIISQSEQVFVDGKRMTRDVDYFIDYDIGQVTFFRPDLVGSDSVVEITYDFAPFGGQGEETLVGMRSEWYILDNLSIGQSVLLNFAPRTRGVPDLRSTSRSITVLEADVNWKNIKLWSFPIQVSDLSAEIAHSIKNPNTAGKATLETFEGIKIEDVAGMNKDSWQVASNPERGHPVTGGTFGSGYAAASAGGRGLTLSNEDFNVTDINKKAVVETSERIQALKIDYNLQSQNEAASVVQILNRAGVDFMTNRRQFVELWVHGDNSRARLQVRLGGISERADNDVNSSPKSEDTNKNGALSPGEDVGWSFVNPDASTTTVGAGNGRLDSQDLDGNGRLDLDDNLGNYPNEVGTEANPLREPDGTTHATVDWDGWKIFQVPLNIPTTGQAEWSTIKHVRLTVANPDAAAKTGTLRFARVAVVGTRFERFETGAVTSTGSVRATIFAQNNQDDPDYPSLHEHAAYQELHDVEGDNAKRREQGLAIEYQRVEATVAPSTITAREKFTTALNLSEHKRLKFFLHGDSSDSTFLFRVGSGENYLEYTTGLNFAGWKVIDLDITDANRDGLLDEGIANTFTRRSGSPDLRSVSEITVGVIVPAGAVQAKSSKIYVNEIHLTESSKVKGTAYRANLAFNWPKWGSWGASWRDVDRNFQTLTTAASGFDAQSGAAYANLNRLKFLPLSSDFTYSRTNTPQVQTLNDPNVLISAINENEVKKNTARLSGNLLMTELPWVPRSIRSKLLNVSFSADQSSTKRSDGGPEDESFNHRYDSSYSLPWQPNVLGPLSFTAFNREFNPAFRPLPTFLSYGFSQTRSTQRRRLIDNAAVTSFADSYSLRTGFQFVPQMPLTASYNYGKSYETSNPVDPSSPTTRAVGRYDKNKNQAVAFSGSLRLFSWLTPSYSYSINTAETYNVNNVVFGTRTFLPGEVKSISRNSSADLSAAVSPKDILQYIPYVRRINSTINTLSFSGSYSVADGDTYENVDGGYDSRYKLIIRGTPLDISNPANPFARRTSLTATDTSRISGRWSPFEGFRFLKSKLWSPLKNLTGSGTFTETLTRRDTTGTLSFTYSKIWPDFVFSTSEVEYPLFLKRWMRDTRLNGNYQERLTEVQNQTLSTGKTMGTDLTFTLFRLLQFTIGYTDSNSKEENLQTQQVTSRTRSRGINGQMISTLKWGNWRLTPRYDQSQSETEDGTGKKTSDLVTRNASLQLFGDVNLPRFFRLPLGKQLTLSNRLILTSSFAYGMVRDGVDETRSRDTMDFNANGDFEMTPNIRLAFGGGFARTMNKAKKEEDVQTLTLTTRVTIQF